MSGGVGVVAGREVRARLVDRTYWWTTVVMALLAAAAVAVPAIVGTQAPDHRVAAEGAAARDVVELAVELGYAADHADADGDAEEVPSVLDALRPAGLPAARLELVVVEAPGDAERLVRDTDVSAALVGDRLDGLRLVGEESVPPEVELLVDAAVARLHVSDVAADHGLTPGEARSLAAPTLPPVELLAPRPAGTASPRVLAVLLALLFSVPVLTLGTALAQSVAEEKQSRVAEVLVAALPARDLLAGKVLGSTVMALGQVVAVGAAALLAGVATGRSALVGQLLGASGWFLAYFVLGFVTLACLWAAAGALAARVEDLHATTVVMQVLVVLPFFATVFAVEPGTVQRALSYLPFTAPLLMPARVVLGTAEPWEPVLGLLVVGAAAAALVASGLRLFRGAVLHTSRRLRGREAWHGVE